jgi:hypothetical protein
MRLLQPTFSRQLIALVLLSGGLLSLGRACQIPVFRYALERWPSDAYVLAVPPQASLDPPARAAVTLLRRAVESGANVRIAETGAPAPVGSLSAIELYSPYSAEGQDQPIWRGELTMADARAIVNSPARSELVKRILEGQSAVWLLIETGDEAKDSAALASLQAAVDAAKTTVQLPDGIIGKNAAAEQLLPIDQQDDVLQSALPLKIDFSILTISRDDPEERVFLKMLMKVEADLEDFTDQVMVFPVFGRGRALEPVIGAGLNGEAVARFAHYICSACSCEVKDQNPGVDLLITADWPAALDGSELVVDKTLPPLEGAGALLATKNDPREVATRERGRGNEPKRDSPFRPLAIAIGSVLLAIAAASFALRRRANSRDRSAN